MLNLNQLQSLHIFVRLVCVESTGSLFYLTNVFCHFVRFSEWTELMRSTRPGSNNRYLSDKVKTYIMTVEIYY